MDNLSCLILAGGQSKRFGENKALYVFDGKSLFERVLETALKVADDIIVSVRDINNLEEFRNETITILNKIYNDSNFVKNWKLNNNYSKRLVEIKVEIKPDNCRTDDTFNHNYNCDRIKKNIKFKNKATEIKDAKIEATQLKDAKIKATQLKDVKIKDTEIKDVKIEESNLYIKYLDVKIIADADNKNSRLKGPLKGIFSCFDYLKNDYVLLLECDAPFFNADCANILINKIQNGDGDNYKNFDAVIPLRSDSTIEPLLACYNRKKTSVILSMLNTYALNLENYDDFIYNDAINISRFIGKVYYFYINDIIKENNRIKSECFSNINDKDSLICILKKINCDNAVGYKNSTGHNSFDFDCNKSVHEYKYDKNNDKDNDNNNMEYNKYIKSIIAVKRNNFFRLFSRWNFNKKNKTVNTYSGRLAKPYGYLANQLYYLKLYSKSKNNIDNSRNIGENNNIDNFNENNIDNFNEKNNINNSNEKNNKNNTDKIYLKKLIFYLNREKNYYLNKNLFFIAAKIQKAINFYKKLQ
jgi:molybdopterin-guanine dinucleotide biosynthesis protein A